MKPYYLLIFILLFSCQKKFKQDPNDIKKAEVLANDFYHNLIDNKIYNQLNKSVNKTIFASALSGYNEYGKITNIKIYSIETERADSSTLDVKYFIRLKVTHGKEVTSDALEFTNNSGSIKLLHHGFIPHSNMRPDPDIAEFDL